MSLSFANRSGKVALVEHEGEWRVCPVEDPDRHFTFAGVYFYGGKTLEEATASAERMASKNGLDFVGRLDEYQETEDG